LDDAVDLVISAHSHEPYVCQLPNRVGRKVVVTSASSYGRVVSDIDVSINTTTKKITSVTAHNILVDRTNAAIQPDAAIARIVEGYAKLAAPIVNRVVGSVAAEVTRTKSAAGETPMGDLIADAELEATKAPGSGGAQVALTNEGGIRKGLQPGDVTYGELFEAQPFGNNMVTMSLTGAQMKTLLEEQFKGCGVGGPSGEAAPDIDRILQPSEGFSYSWSKDGAVCNKVDAASIKIGGVVVKPEAKYRVTVNNLLADGGEQVYVLKQGVCRRVGPTDLDVMTAYLAKHSPVQPPVPHRITVIP
jgi:5'-nucleotidase